MSTPERVSGRFGMVAGAAAGAALVLGLAGGVGLSVNGGLGEALSPSPAMAATAEGPRVAVVDVVRLINELEQLNERSREIKTLADELTADLEQARRDARDAQDALQMATDATREELLNEALEATLRIREITTMREIRVRMKQNQVLRETWAMVQEEVRAHGRAQGYDVVIADDSLVEPGIPLDADPEAFKSFVVDRRVLFAADAADITSEIITRMNNQYNAGR